MIARWIFLPARPRRTASPLKPSVRATPSRLFSSCAMTRGRKSAARSSRLPRTKVVEQGENFLRAECRSAFAGFIDDLTVELRTRATHARVALRRAHRLLRFRREPPPDRKAPRHATGARNFVRRAANRSGIRSPSAIQLPAMSTEPVVQTISSGSEQRMNIPVITVGGFFKLHAKELQLKLEGEADRFRAAHPRAHDQSSRPRARRVLHLLRREARAGARRGGAILPEGSLDAAAAARFRALCAQKIPCLVVSRGFHLSPELLAIAEASTASRFSARR